MAQKNSSSRAQKAVSEVKKKNTGASTAAPKKTSPAVPQKTPGNRMDDESRIPLRIFLAIVALALFVLFLVIGVNPEGALLKAIQAILMGLFG